MSYIVVSDVHLGSDSSNFNEFCDFLEWVRGLENRDELINYKDKEVTKEIKVHSPEKLVLLGDILELWDPIDGSRDYVIKESLKPISILSDTKCDKVYVVGNHDEALSELESDVDHVTLLNGTKLDIWNRHYPDSLRGLQIGCKFYFFLHGHQFDKEQAVLARVSSLIGETWNPLGWFQELFNVTFTKKHWKFNGLLFLVLLLGGWKYWDNIQTSSFVNIPVLIAWIVMVVFGGRYLWHQFFRVRLQYTIIWAALTVMIVYAGGWYIWTHFQPSSFLNTLIWSALTGFFALGSIPGIVTRSQRSIYDNLSKPIDKTAEQVIIKDKYYRKDKDMIRSDVVIFGHTHFASSYLLEDKKTNIKKLFLNSGTWTGKDELIDGKQRYANTFIYIDEAGAYILAWRGCGRIECIEAFPELK